ncbi:hypothetical protein DVR14_01000 (plasmid) [Natrinema thermotolerans]|nr:hypothetical protein DVR14_01000 [Natrinema thermotolerans]
MEVKNDDAEVWVIRRGGETVTRVNVAKMRVSTQLAQFLDAIADGETPPIGPVCESCPIQSLAGD